MRLNLLILFLAIGLLVRAQSWEYFPLDSIRAYQVSQYGTLRGLDLRKHEKVSGNTTVFLDSFSHYYELPDTNLESGTRYYITGNSDFGYSITHRTGDYIIHFLSDTSRYIVHDSIIISKTRELGNKWTFLNNDTILIYATISGMQSENTLFGEDSVLTIALQSVHKRTLDTFHNELKIAKNFGLLSCPNLNSIRRSAYQISEYVLRPYVEMSEYDFFRPIPGTRLHLNKNKTRHSNYLIEQYFYNNHYFIIGTDTLVRRITYTLFHSWNHKVESYENDTIEYRDLEYSKVGVFNPLPGNIYRNTNASLFCESNFLKIHTSVGDPSQPIPIAYDTLFTPYHEGEYCELSRTYTQHLGLTSFIDQCEPGGVNEHMRLEYLETNHCQTGSKLEQFSSISGLDTLEVSVHPNPASQYFTISGAENFTNIVLTDALGHTFKPAYDAGHIIVSDLPAGLYFGQIEKNESIYSFKILIQHP